MPYKEVFYKIGKIIVKYVKKYNILKKVVEISSKLLYNECKQ